MNDQYTPAAQIVLLLAKAAEPMDDDGCVLCQGRWDPVRDLREYAHAPDCPWQLAREWLDGETG